LNTITSIETYTKQLNRYIIQNLIIKHALRMVNSYALILFIFTICK